MSKHGFNFLLGSACAAATLMFASPAAFSQGLASNSASVALTATLNETLTVAATPATVTFTLAPTGGIAASNVPVAITTTWVLGAGRANVVVEASFSSATAALTGVTTATDVIPSALVSGQVTTGTPVEFTPFTQTAVLGTPVAGLSLVTVPLTAANRSATRTDNLQLQIDTTTLPQLSAQNYAGTLTIQAQAL